jgi:hypothetical protein
MQTIETKVTAVNPLRSRLKTFAVREVFRPGESTPWVRDEVLSDLPLDQQVNDYFEVLDGSLRFASPPHYQIIGKDAEGLLHTLGSISIIHDCYDMEQNHGPPSSRAGESSENVAFEKNVEPGPLDIIQRSTAELLTSASTGMAESPALAKFGYR